jgi:hypothetical protein
VIIIIIKNSLKEVYGYIHTVITFYELIRLANTEVCLDREFSVNSVRLDRRFPTFFFPTEPFLCQKILFVA